MFYHYPIISHESRFPIYLVSLGMHECQPYVRRGTEYAFPQLFYCTKGKGILRTADGVYEIKGGTGFFLPASYPHEYYPDGDVWDNHWIIPGGYACDEMLRGMGLDRLRVFTLDNTDRLDSIFSDIHNVLLHDGISGNIRASGYLYDLLIEFDRQLNHIGTVKTDPPLRKCIDFINTGYQQKITMDDLCALTGMTKQHICRLFRTVLGARPMEYTAKRRIQAAKELLSGSDRSIEEIAELTGFGSSSYFCKLFRRYEGITPTQFRNG